MRILLALTMTAPSVSVFGNTTVNAAVPSMRAEFGASAGQAGWVATGCSLIYGIAVVIYGRVSDLFGLQRFFALGLATFALGSIACAPSPSMPVPVGGRLL